MGRRDDLVVVVSNKSTQRTVSQVVDRHDHTLLASPIFKQLVAFNDYETLSRGFVDLKQLINEPFLKITNQYALAKVFDASDWATCNSSSGIRASKAAIFDPLSSYSSRASAKVC